MQAESLVSVFLDLVLASKLAIYENNTQGNGKQSTKHIIYCLDLRTGSRNPCRLLKYEMMKTAALLTSPVQPKHMYTKCEGRQAM